VAPDSLVTLRIFSHYNYSRTSELSMIFFM
jgi:hypothetical protein